MLELLDWAAYIGGLVTPLVLLFVWLRNTRPALSLVVYPIENGTFARYLRVQNRSRRVMMLEAWSETYGVFLGDALIQHPHAQRKGTAYYVVNPGSSIDIPISFDGESMRVAKDTKSIQLNVRSKNPQWVVSVPRLSKLFTRKVEVADLHAYKRSAMVYFGQPLQPLHPVLLPDALQVSYQATNVAENPKPLPGSHAAMNALRAGPPRTASPLPPWSIMDILTLLVWGISGSALSLTALMLLGVL